MVGEHRQRRAGRLLTCAFAALALSAAFAGTAQAGLDNLTGQQDPIAATVGGATANVAGAATTVGEVTSTVTVTVGTATSTTPTTGDPVGTTVSTATGVVSNATQTVSDTAEGASQTVANTTQAVTQTVSSTTQAVTSTVEQTVAATGDTLGGVTSRSSSTIEQGAHQLVPASAATPTLSARSSSAQPSITVSHGSAAAPVPGTGSDASVDGTEPSGVVIASTPLQSGGPSTAGTSQNRVVPPTPSARRAAPQPSPPAFLSAKPDGARGERASVPRAPQAPLPGLPSSITALLGGSSASVSFGLAALLGALLLTAFGSPGSRLRPGGAVVRLPDVFSSLERPG